LSVREVLMGLRDDESIKNITRAYAVAETVKECPGCVEGQLAVDPNDGGEYRVPCPLLHRECAHGQALHVRLDACALRGILSLSGVPAWFSDRLGEPQPTAAVRGVNVWSCGQKCFLALHGEHGTGKSFGAAYALYVIARQRLMANWKLPVLWTPMPAMWASAYRVTSKDDLFEAARVAPALVVDDMGSEENAGRAKARLTEIVSERYNQRRLTILTMNDDALTLANTYGQRMADRILGAGHTVYCGGESLRLSAWSA
jgi:hypothetical protein